jgi:hypothetical protein
MKNFGSLTIDELRCIFDNLGGYDGAQRFLEENGDLVLEETDKAFSLRVVSGGMPGANFTDHFETIEKYRLGGVKSLLLSDDFKPTSGVKTDIVIIKGSTIYDDERDTLTAIDIAKQKKSGMLNLELACLLRRTLSNHHILRKMRLDYIVVPVSHNGDILEYVLDIDPKGLCLSEFNQFHKHRIDVGFAFVESNPFYYV